MNYRQARIALAYMEQALAATLATAEKVARNWRDEAEAVAVAQAAKSRRCYRHQTSWTAADESRFATAHDALFPRFGRDLERLEAKAARQRLAIATLLRKHRFNDRPGQR